MWLLLFSFAVAAFREGQFLVASIRSKNQFYVSIETHIPSLSYCFLILCELFLKGASANASPRYQKLRERVTHMLSNRSSHLYRSAMIKTRAGGTAFVITVDPYAR
jgi:hypothetical protein